MASNEDRLPTPRLGVLFAAAALLPFAVWVVARSLSADLWHDEIWSLQHYSLQSLLHVVTDYTHSDNHVFYNVLEHLWLRAIGCDTMEHVLAAPALVRLPSLLFALGCAVCVARLARGCFGPVAGWLAPAALVTSMPFFHFALQARGYSLSMLLIAWLLVHVRRASEGSRRLDRLAIPALAALAVYTLPSNLAPVIAIAVWQGAETIVLWRTGSERAPDARRVSTMLALGTVVGILLYAPMLGQMLDLRGAVDTGAVAAGPAPLAALPPVLNALVSYHWLLVLLLIPGLIVAPSRDRVRAGWLGWLLIAPFAVAAVSGDRPYARVYVVLCPVVAALLGGGAAALLQTRAVTGVARAGAAAILVALCQGQFAWHTSAIDSRLRSGLAQGAAPRTLDHAYFTRYFEPDALGQRLRTAGATRCLMRDGDPVAVRAYLELHDVEVLGFNELTEVVRGGGVARIITADPAATVAEVRKLLPAAHTDLEESLTFHRVVTAAVPAK